MATTAETKRAGAARGLDGAHEKIEKLLNDAQTALDDSDAIPCRKHKGSSCIAVAHNLPLDEEDRQQFWYGVDCELPRKTFCAPCLASWLVSVARNIVGEDRRWHAATKAEASR
jgi:hypothetical protein